MKKIYEWLDKIWQKVAEIVFVRFAFDLPVDRLQQLSQSGRIVFALSTAGFIEWLILSSWSRKNGLGAILVANRKRILLLSKPLYFFQILFRRKSYSQLFLSDEHGPRLIFCPPGERKRPFQPMAVEKLLGEVYSQLSEEGQLNHYIFVPTLILWRRYTRETARKPYEYLLGLGTRPSLLGKIWYLIRRRPDSSVRALDCFTMVPPQPKDTLDYYEPEPQRAARRTRRKILVQTHQELRVVLGPRQPSPHMVKETILRDPEMVEAIDRLSKEEGIDRKKVLLRAYRNLNEIVSNFKYRSVEIMYFFLTWLFTKLFNGVNIVQSQIQQIREATKTKPVVFICSHRSHLDYLVIPYVLYLHDMAVPHVAAGINMAFWPLGSFLRSGGAFFIRRSFRGDPLYRLCLSKYLEFLLKNRNTFFYFIEGTRSRSGKMLPPAYGLLKMLLELHEQGVVEDIALVPTSFCYDQVPEETSYTKELGGEKKTKESAAALIKSRRIVRRKIGRVYLRFSPSLSTQQAHKIAEDKHQDNTLRLQKVAFELCKRIADITPITPKAITSTIFVAHPQSSLSLEDILEIAHHMGSYVQHSKLSLSQELGKGFRIAVEQTVRQLRGSGILTIEKDHVPRLYGCDPKKRSTLNYYKNTGIHCYVVPSILMLAFFDYLQNNQSNGNHTRSLQEEINTRALQLRNSLKFEFFFSPRSEFLKELHHSGSYFFSDPNWTEKQAAELVDQLFKNLWHWDRASLYMRMMGDILESYLTTVEVIEKLPYGNHEKKSLLQDILKAGTNARSEGRATFPESVSTQNYSNALLLLANEKFISLDQKPQRTEFKVQEWPKEASQFKQTLQNYLELLRTDLGTFVKQHYPPSH